MSTLEIVSGVLLLISSLFIILVTLLQETKQQGMTSALGGDGMGDSFYGKNTGRSREAKLVKLTTVMAIIFFVVTIAVNLIHVLSK